MRSFHSAAYRRLLERLRAARRARGLTQQEVARAFGRSQSFVAKCESGERRVDAVELAHFAEIYGQSLDYFVEARQSGGAQLAAEDGASTRWPKEASKRRSVRRR